MVQLGFTRGVHGLLHLAHGARRALVYGPVVEHNGQGQGQGRASQGVPEVFFEQNLRLRLGAGTDVVGVHIAVRIQVQSVAGAGGGGAADALGAVALLAQAFFSGLTGQILHPAQGNAVVGQAAGVGRMVGQAALPEGGEGVGFLKRGSGHDGLLAGGLSCRPPGSESDRRARRVKPPCRKARLV